MPTRTGRKTALLVLCGGEGWVPDVRPMSWKNSPFPYIVSWGTIETGKQSWEVRACWVRFFESVLLQQKKPPGGTQRESNMVKLVVLHIWPGSE
jgi:hypothetical protein